MVDVLWSASDVTFSYTIEVVRSFCSVPVDAESVMSVSDVAVSNVIDMVSSVCSVCGDDMSVPSVSVPVSDGDDDDVVVGTVVGSEDFGVVPRVITNV